MDLFGSPLTVSLDPAAMQALHAITGAVQGAGKAAKEAGDEAKDSAGGWTELKSKIDLIAGTISTVVGTVHDFASAVAELSAEQAQLDGQSARLNLNFDQSAAAAGRFADETDAMRVATAAAESGLRMTQTEIDAFMRRAGQYSQATGQDMTASTQRLTEALMAGSQEGLNRFGGELARAAEGGSTLGERLQALTTDANSMAAATDDAGTAMARAQDSFDDMKRAAAAAFTEQLSAAGALNRALGETRQGADDTSDRMRALGRLGADTVQLIGGTIGTVLGGIAYVASTAYSAAAGVYDAIEARVQGRGTAGARAAFEARWREGQETRDTIAGFTMRAGSAVEDVTSGRSQDEARDRDVEAGQARRDQETADRIGAETLRAAGFNPDGTPLRGGARGRRTGGGSSAGGAANDNATAAPQDALSSAADGLLASMIARARRGAADIQRSLSDRSIDAEMGNRRADVLGRADAGTVERSNAAKLRAQEERDRERDIRRERSLTDQLEEQFTRRTTLAQEMATGIRSAYDKMASGAGAAYAAIVKGGDDLGATLRQILADTLLSIGQESAVKALLNVAEGIAAVATYRYDAAASHFAAAGVYGAVAVAAGIGASVAAPGGQTSTQARGSGASDQRAAPVNNRSRSGDGEQTVVIALGGTGGDLVFGTRRQVMESLVGAINDHTRRGGMPLRLASSRG